MLTLQRLQVSDKVLLSKGTCATIEEIQVEQLSKSETTYNFEVEDFHTYYVSESKVLVHNLCKKDIYKSVKDSQNYDPNFEPAHKTTFDKVKRADLARDLQKVDPGKWVKAYQNGYIDGTKYSLHYFKNKINGHVFNVKYISGWVI